MNLVKLLPISLALVAFVALTGAQCSPEEIERYTALIKGTTVPPAQSAPSPVIAAPVVATGFLLIQEDDSSVSSSEEVSIAYVPEPVIEPPAPPPCENTVWRDHVYDCHGAWLYDL